MEIKKLTVYRNGNYVDCRGLNLLLIISVFHTVIKNACGNTVQVRCEASIVQNYVLNLSMIGNKLDITF
jgi:hypothetical protein